MTSAPADVWVSANDLLEGDAVVVDRTGEVVPRHPNTRVVFTDNRPLGDAGETDDYLGRNAQDRSVLDRCWHIAARWPDERSEVRLLLLKTQRFRRGLTEKRAEAIAVEAVRFARATRESDRGERLFELSTRSLVRFTTLLFTFAAAGNVANAAREALALALTDGLSAGASAGLQNAMNYDFGRINALVSA